MRANALVIALGIGMGVYRCSHEWPVWFFETHSPVAVGPFMASDAFIFVDVGKVLGVVAYAALCYLVGRDRWKGPVFLLPSVVIVAGYLLPAASALGAPVPTWAAMADMVVCGMGVGMLFAQWIEVFGLLVPAKAMQAFAISYLTRFVLLPALTGGDTPAVAIFAVLLAGTSFLQVAACLALAREASERPAGGTLGAVPARSLELGGAFRDISAVLVWAAVYAFGYGLSEAATSLGHSVHFAGLGYVLPSILILALTATLKDRFDGNALIAVSLSLIAAGLLSYTVFNMGAEAAQILISAGMSAFEILAYTLVCSYAHRRRESAMFPSACLRVVALAAADLAVVMVRTVGGLDLGVLSMVAVVASFAASFLIVLPRTKADGDSRFRPEEVGIARDGESERRGRLKLVAEGAGLSPREETVFWLLVDGKTYDEISEELFISNGAVRAHCSRIYDKCGIHSRIAFDQEVLGSPKTPA